MSLTLGITYVDVYSVITMYLLNIKCNFYFKKMKAPLLRKPFLSGFGSHIASGAIARLCYSSTEVAADSPRAAGHI